MGECSAIRIGLPEKGSADDKASFLEGWIQVEDCNLFPRGRVGVVTKGRGSGNSEVLQCYLNNHR